MATGEVLFRKVKRGEYLYFSKGIFSSKALVVTYEEKQQILSMDKSCMLKIMGICSILVPLGIIFPLVGIPLMLILNGIVIAQYQKEKSLLLANKEIRIVDDWTFSSYCILFAQRYSWIELTKLGLASLIGLIFSALPFIGYVSSNHSVAYVFAGLAVVFCLIGFILTIMLIFFKFFRFSCKR